MIPIGPALYLILLAVKYRDGYWTTDNEEDEKEFVREALKPGAGLDYEPPQRKKTKLRVVK